MLSGSKQPQVIVILCKDICKLNEDLPELNRLFICKVSTGTKEHIFDVFRDSGLDIQQPSLNIRHFCIGGLGPPLATCLHRGGIILGSTSSDFYSFSRRLTLITSVMDIVFTTEILPICTVLNNFINLFNATQRVTLTKGNKVVGQIANLECNKAIICFIKMFEGKG